ncbi:MAG: hypothetical protein KAT16_03150 [Candidatus Heimdallarchaeota archaeon]|nr:hypothetical protein [Candidatus Heimdallarchaeota archaeon]
MSDKNLPLDGMGLVFSVIEHNKRPEVLWSGSTWHTEISSWDLLVKILAAKNNLEDIGWSFLPLLWESNQTDHEVEIFALTKFFPISGIGTAYLIIYHQTAEILTQFLLLEEENLALTFERLLTLNWANTRLSNVQLKQIRIKCQEYYEILSQIQT